jgi:hypothetical protein
VEGGVVGGVGRATGVGGLGETEGSECIDWSWAEARESVSSKTQTRLLIVMRTLFTSRLLAGRVDTSFNVDPRDWRELEAMKSQRAKEESQAKPRRYS